jgi:phage-related minor tail protein
MEKEVKGITVEINGNASGLEAALDGAIEKAEKLNSLLREASEILHSFHTGD